MATNTNFWLIRHGETDWNAMRKLQGWRDIPLNETGLEQARVLALALQAPAFTHTIDAVVSSDLIRANETARIATEHFQLPILTDAGLRERGFGVLEGADWETLKHDAGKEGAFNVRDPDQPVKDGETLRVFQQRVVDAFDALAQRLGGKNVLVFSHGGVIDAVWRRLNDVALDMPRPFDIRNTSINCFSISTANGWTAGEWGLIDHLAQPAMDELR